MFSQAQAKKLVRNKGFFSSPMSPVPWSLRLYCRLSAYFLSDLTGNRDSEIFKIAERARWRAEILIERLSKLSWWFMLQKRPSQRKEKYVFFFFSVFWRKNLGFLPRGIFQTSFSLNLGIPVKWALVSWCYLVRKTADCICFERFFIGTHLDTLRLSYAGP